VDAKSKTSFDLIIAKKTASKIRENYLETEKFLAACKNKDLLAHETLEQMRIEEGKDDDPSITIIKASMSLFLGHLYKSKDPIPILLAMLELLILRETSRIDFELEVSEKIGYLLQETKSFESNQWEKYLNENNQKMTKMIEEAIKSSTSAQMNYSIELINDKFERRFNQIYSYLGIKENQEQTIDNQQVKEQLDNLTRQFTNLENSIKNLPSIEEKFKTVENLITANQMVSNFKTNINNLNIKRKMQGKENKTPRCNNCKKIGHLQNNCWEIFPEKLICITCGGKGHKFKHCPNFKFYARNADASQKVTIAKNVYTSAIQLPDRRTISRDEIDNAYLNSWKYHETKPPDLNPKLRKMEEPEDSEPPELDIKKKRIRKEDSDEDDLPDIFS